MIEKATPSRIIFLDYLRVFAFVSVLIGHKFFAYLQAFINDPHVHVTSKWIVEFLMPFCRFGGAGVVVFFMVSGYIIAYILHIETPFQFMVKRVFRIYPLYMVAVIIEYIPLLIMGRAQDGLTLISQLLLIGDFFSTPYALNGVEWTLRIEFSFYILMAILRYFGFFTSRAQMLSFALIALTLICAFMAPIPSGDVWSKGYVTLYAPFLFVGVFFYLFESNRVSLQYLIVFLIFVFGIHLNLIAKYQKSFINEHFAILALMLFTVLYFFRQRIYVIPGLLLLSEMTYSVYLFHHWFFEYAKKAFSVLHLEILHPDIQALIVLLVFCFLMGRFIERPGIRLGQHVLKYLNNLIVKSRLN